MSFPYSEVYNAEMMKQILKEQFVYRLPIRINHGGGQLEDFYPEVSWITFAGGSAVEQVVNSNLDFFNDFRFMIDIISAIIFLQEIYIGETLLHKNRNGFFYNKNFTHSLIRSMEGLIEEWIDHYLLNESSPEKRAKASRIKRDLLIGLRFIYSNSRLLGAEIPTKLLILFDAVCRRNGVHIDISRINLPKLIKDAKRKSFVYFPESKGGVRRNELDLLTSAYLQFSFRLKDLDFSSNNEIKLEASD